MALKGSSQKGLLPLYDEHTKQPIATSEPNHQIIILTKRDEYYVRRHVLKKYRKEDYLYSSELNG